MFSDSHHVDYVIVLAWILPKVVAIGIKFENGIPHICPVDHIDDIIGNGEGGGRVSDGEILNCGHK